MTDREQLADFLRRRREDLQPDDVGMSPGPRRRVRGLRREEVASLAGMSTDYLTRLEQRRGPQPSTSMVTALARALRLTADERDHLFRLAGHQPPDRARRTDHVSPALLRVLDRVDAPALVITDLGVTLAQNPGAVALLGLQTEHRDHRRHLLYRWFTDPREQGLYPPEDRTEHQAQYVATLRSVLAKAPDDPEAQRLLALLLRTSPEFRTVWTEHRVGARPAQRKRIIAPEVGPIVVDCQVLSAEETGQALLVFTATPGTADHDKLRLLMVIGAQRLTAGPPVGAVRIGGGDG